MSLSKLQNVQFMAVGRKTDDCLLASFSRDTSGPANATSEEMKTAHKLLKASKKRMTAGQRQKLAWNKDQVFAYLETGEAELLVMCIMSGQTYPERIAFQMLVDLLNFIRDAADEEVNASKENGMNSVLMETITVLAKK